MNRLHLNMGLVVLVAGLGAALYLSRESVEQGPPLTTLNASAVDRIRIEHPGQPAIALLRHDDEWQLTEPVTARADAVEVGAILNLAQMEAKRTLTVADVSLEELKLDPPRYRVRLNDTLLEFGDTEPIEFRRYIRIGDQIALTDDPPSAALDADYSDLVNKELLPPGTRLRRIDVPGLTLARSADGAHWQETPAQPDVSADDKQRLVDTWTSARALWNSLTPAMPSGSGEPITLVTDDGEMALRVIAREPQLVIENPALGIRYTLSKALEGELLRLPSPPAPTEAREPTSEPSDAPHAL